MRAAAKIRGGGASGISYYRQYFAFNNTATYCRITDDNECSTPQWNAYHHTPAKTTVMMTVSKVAHLRRRSETAKNNSITTTTTTASSSTSSTLPFAARRYWYRSTRELWLVVLLVMLVGSSNAGGASVVATATTSADDRRPGYSATDHNRETVESLVRQWAPLVWLAPGEQFMPGNVNDFLRNVHAEKSTVEASSVLQQTADILDVSDDVLLYELDREIGNSEELVDTGVGDESTRAGADTVQPHTMRPNYATARSPFRMERVIDLPIGKRSMDWFLTANDDVDVQLSDGDSFLYGQDPNRGKVPIYAVVSMCDLPLSAASDQRFGENDVDFHDRSGRKTSYIPINSMHHIYRSNWPTTDGTAATLKRSRQRFKRDTKSNVTKTVTLPLGSSFPINSTSTTSTTSPARLDRIVPQFHVTYWMFYPYNQGKTICTLNLGPFGRLPIPQLFGKCLGTRRDFGSHVGDWEHMTLYFRGGPGHEPAEMYVSAHDAGAYYTFERLSGSFEFRRQETRQHHLLQQPVFPKTVRTLGGSHPVLFSALGSHGLWTAPGSHRFVRVPRLVDVNGFGTPWYTWKNMEFSYDNRQMAQQPQRGGRRSSSTATNWMDGPEWLQYMGRWGNAKNKCHPLKRLGIHFCEYNDGPTGIPLKEPHFGCKR